MISYKGVTAYLTQFGVKGSTEDTHFMKYGECVGFALLRTKRWTMCWGKEALDKHDYTM